MANRSHGDRCLTGYARGHKLLRCENAFCPFIVVRLQENFPSSWFPYIWGSAADSWTKYTEKHMKAGWCDDSFTHARPLLETATIKRWRCMCEPVCLVTGPSCALFATVEGILRFWKLMVWVLTSRKNAGLNGGNQRGCPWGKTPLLAPGTDRQGEKRSQACPAMAKRTGTLGKPKTSAPPFPSDKAEEGQPKARIPPFLTAICKKGHNFSRYHWLTLGKGSVRPSSPLKSHETSWEALKPHEISRSAQFPITAEREYFHHHNRSGLPENQMATVL